MLFLSTEAVASNPLVKACADDRSGSSTGYSGESFCWNSSRNGWEYYLRKSLHARLPTQRWGSLCLTPTLHPRRCSGWYCARTKKIGHRSRPGLGPKSWSYGSLYRQRYQHWYAPRHSKGPPTGTTNRNQVAQRLATSITLILKARTAVRAYFICKVIEYSRYLHFWGNCDGGLEMVQTY